MKKFLSILTIFSVLLLSFPFAVIAQEAVEEDLGYYEATLYAGQTEPVGGVQVWNDDTNLYVKYVVDEPWCLYETHLEVNITTEAFPWAGGKTKNVVPGQFDYSEPHECVPDKEYTVLLNDIEGWESGKNLIIGAHAVVKQFSEHYFCSNSENNPTESVIDEYISEVGNKVWGPRYDNAAGDIDLDNWDDYSLAVEAVNNISGTSWVWGKGNAYNPTYDPDIEEVKWISTAADTEVWDVDSWRLFQETFNVPDDATSIDGNVTVNADNEYWVYLNGSLHGTDNNIWNALLTHPFTPNIGDNTLTFLVKNWGQTDAQVNNPNGLTYKAVVTYDIPCDLVDEETRSESAWGASAVGEKRFTEQGNWATHFSYTVEASVCSLQEYVLNIDSVNNNSGYKHKFTIVYDFVNNSFSGKGESDHAGLQTLSGFDKTVNYDGTLSYIKFRSDYAGTYFWFPAFNLSEGGVLGFVDIVGDNVFNATGTWAFECNTEAN